MENLNQMTTGTREPREQEPGGRDDVEACLYNYAEDAEYRQMHFTRVTEDRKSVV